METSKEEKENDAIRDSLHTELRSRDMHVRHTSYVDEYEPDDG